MCYLRSSKSTSVTASQDTTESQHQLHHIWDPTTQRCCRKSSGGPCKGVSWEIRGDCSADSPGLARLVQTLKDSDLTALANEVAQRLPN